MVKFAHHIFAATAVSLLVFTASARAGYANWVAGEGYWASPSSWDVARAPADGDVIQLRKGAAIARLNTDEGLLECRLSVYGGQTLTITDGGRVGTTWTRVGSGSVAYVNMSGNAQFVMNHDDLYIGVYDGGYCEWRMSDTASIAVNDGGSDDILCIADGGSALFELDGSGVRVSADKLYVGCDVTGTASAANSAVLSYVLDASGASRITAGNAYISQGALASAALAVSGPDVDYLAPEDIVLLEITGNGVISGAFDMINGAPAGESEYAALGGNLYRLSYAYDASGDGNRNDLALVYQADPWAMLKVSEPSPADGAEPMDCPLELAWTNPRPLDGVSDIVCTVYLGFSANRAEMESVTLAANASSVAIAPANFPLFGAQPVYDGQRYYWCVDCLDESAAAPDNPVGGVFLSFMPNLSLPRIDGFGGNATGGEGGVEKQVSSASQLIYWAKYSQPVVITITESFTITGGNGVGGGACEIVSDKTIRGANPDVVITGNFELKSGASNVVIENLTIHNPDDPENMDAQSLGGSDCITIYGAKNVRVSHCTIYDAADGLLDIRDAADNITVSWNKFYYTRSWSHNLASLGAGAGDEDFGEYHVTWHHNWWSALVNQRMPMIRFGSAHMYNNYFNCSGNYYCTSSRIDAQILSERNYYQDVHNPIYKEPGYDGKIKTVENVYDNSHSPNMPLAAGDDTVFTPSYYYRTDASADVPLIIMTTAGNRFYGDFNDDGVVSSEDMVYLAEFWLNAGSAAAWWNDTDADGFAGMAEFALFAENWL